MRLKAARVNDSEAYQVACFEGSVGVEGVLAVERVAWRAAPVWPAGAADCFGGDVLVERTMLP